MAIIITIFKSQLAANPGLIIELEDITNESTQLEDAFVYVPKQGQVVDFINLLNHHNVAYNINSEGNIE
jgi:hypothetical protein